MREVDLNNVLVVIPARGGSKGVPNKNIKLLNRKPLIHYTIEAAQEVFNDSQILVSTDDEKIKAVAEEKGLNVPFLRPNELATDHSSTHDVLLHAINYMEANNWFPKTLILLQPTSPFRTGKHISDAMELFNDNIDAVVSVMETKSNPYYVLMEEDNQGFLEKSKKGDFTRRQDCPKVWELNGAIYITSIEKLKTTQISAMQKVKKYVMDEFNSHDIDTMLDWTIAETLCSDKK